ncbi:reverse transcriptase family protein [Chitinophagaceae bacterium MMS25-I14]
MSDKLTRQQIYDRIKATSKDSYILEEMKRLGFWEASEMPTLSETLINREVVLTQELNQLLEQDRRYSNREAMLREMRKARMKQALEKRDQTKQRNKQKRLDKAARWKQTQQQEIIYLGDGVSGGLSNTDSDAQLLQRYDLPAFGSITALAESMQTDIASLRYLLYQRKVSRINHYHVFEVPKKSGGKRLISAPKKRLKNLQQWVLTTILDRIPVNDHIHGFTRQRSIVTNAQPHLKKDIVINMDLKDFFPTITYGRVKGLFHKLGYSEQLATIFALICTQPETEEVEMDGVRYYVQKGHRFLPQGSPASPAISNLIAYRLDKKVQGLAAKLGFTYTRYADDLSFSASEESAQHIAKLLYFLRKIVESEGFSVHPEKTHIMRSGGQQKVTGIVVNEKLNIERDKLRKFRALLHNIETHGWKDQQWGKAKHLINAVEGYIHYVQMVNPQKGKTFRQQLEQIVTKHGYPVVEQPAMSQPPATPPPVAEIPEMSRPEKPAPPVQTDWWNILS